MWSIFSIFEEFLSPKENIDIRKFSKLVPYINRKHVGYRAKQSKTFTKEDIMKTVGSYDIIYLLMKVITELQYDRECKLSNMCLF